MRRCSIFLIRFAVIAALAIGSGAHLAVVQGLAWTNMLIDYSRKANSLVEAVEMTFDGQHPCKMCVNVIEANKPQQAPPDATHPMPELKAVLPLEGHPFAPGFAFVTWIALREAAALRNHAPPVPPPRAA